MVGGNIKLGMIVLKCPGNPQMAKKKKTYKVL